MGLSMGTDTQNSGYFEKNRHDSFRISNIKVSKMPSPFKISPEKGLPKRKYRDFTINGTPTIGKLGDKMKNFGGMYSEMKHSVDEGD